MKMKNRIVSFALASALMLGGGATAFAVEFGNKLNGASSVEVYQIRYDGVAWNYPGSGYKSAWFKYHRNGKTLMYKVAKNGKVTGSVWDNLFDWSKKQTTKFNWGNSR